MSTLVSHPNRCKTLNSHEKQCRRSCRVSTLISAILMYEVYACEVLESNSPMTRWPDPLLPQTKSYESQYLGKDIS